MRTRNVLLVSAVGTAIGLLIGSVTDHAVLGVLVGLFAGLVFANLYRLVAFTSRDPR